MQRPTYSSVPPAHSPPLHHPVPQHISQVPNMRSPSPPAPQPAQAQHGAQNYGWGGAGFTQPPFGALINENTAQMGAQYAEQFMDKQFQRYVNVSALKKLFDVTNSYVLNKLIVVLFPYRQRTWVRKTSAGYGAEGVTYASPREDVHSPDMYIPTMGLVTYCLLSTLLAGLKGAFDPALLSQILSWAAVVVIVEIMILRGAIYFLNITSESSLLDLVAYSGYKFVGINVTVLLAEVWNRGGGTGGWFGWTIFFYCYLANAFFLLRSLRYVLLGDGATSGSSNVSYTAAGGRSQKQSRLYFLFAYSYIAQFLFMYVLSRHV